MVEEVNSQFIELLENLISTPSLSREENKTADLIEVFFNNKSIHTHRNKNNVWATNQYFDEIKPTILLNSHHDTVKPSASWTFDPFKPTQKDGKLYGLGSNDAGGALVSLMATFCYFYDNPNLKYNLVLAATAEEEISGRNGIELILNDLPTIDFAIVGEPTEMQLAIAEKGLLVLDCTTRGKAGHAARNEGDNAIYKALNDIRWFQQYQFSKISPTLGPILMSVTLISAGSQHNVVPDVCTFTVDIRVTEQYGLEEIIEIIKQNVATEVLPRSVRLRPSGIATSHPIVQAGLALGRNIYGSPTLSDQALLTCPSLKIGPGKSERSHSADEFIFLDEIKEGIELYIQLLKNVVL